MLSQFSYIFYVICCKRLTKCINKYMLDKNLCEKTTVNVFAGLRLQHCVCCTTRGHCVAKMTAIYQTLSPL